MTTVPQTMLGCRVHGFGPPSAITIEEIPLPMTLTITIIGNGIHRLKEAAKTLGEAEARTAYSRAINHSAKVAGTGAGRALSAQTGLPKSTGRRRCAAQGDYVHSCHAGLHHPHTGR